MVPGLTLEQVRQQERRSVHVTAGLMLGGTALAALLFLALGNPILGAAAVGGIILLAALVRWLWEQPVRGVYVLVGAAVLLATYVEAGLTDYIGWYMPFFEDIKSSTHIGIVVSPAEIFMALTLLIWVLKGIANRDFRFDGGSLMLPIALYMVMVLVAEGRGLTSGGSLRDSLWEVRSQAYMLVAYVLVCNLVKTRAHLIRLLWLLLIFAAVRGIEGTYQYLFVFRAHDVSRHELYPHEQSYFFNGFLTLTIVLFVFGGPRRMKVFALWLLPFVIVANLANNRRASIAALALSLIVLFLVTWLVQPRYRRVVGWCLLALAVVYPPYFVAYQHNTGLLALPARAIASSFHPDPNDALSNQYRVAEDLDIMTTVKSNTTTAIIGYGYGKPMMTPYPLTNSGYLFMYLLPHNSLLWVWMRLGSIGYLIFWFLIGTAVMQMTRLVRRLRDRFLQGLTLFVLLMLLQQVIIAYVDLQWSNFRTMIMTGVLFALISRLSLIGAAEARAAASATQPRTVVEARRRPVVQRKVRSVAAAARTAASALAGQAATGLQVVQRETDAALPAGRSKADWTDGPRRRRLRVITARPAADPQAASSASQPSPLYIVEAEAVTPRTETDTVSSNVVEGQLIHLEPMPPEIVAHRVTRKKRLRWIDRRAPDQN